MESAVCWMSYEMAMIAGMVLTGCYILQLRECQTFSPT